MSFEPRIVGFLCNWCSYTGADLAGTSRMKYAPNVRVIRVMCSGRMDPTFVLKAFREGADGVLLLGCHPGDCHYQNGNMKTLRRVPLLRRVLGDLGFEPERLRLEWVSASEGERYKTVINDFVEQIRKLGPLDLEVRRAPAAAAAKG
jgi:F420-non-reducing hydrogenase iron-sulfur subunit